MRDIMEDITEVNSAVLRTTEIVCSFVSNNNLPAAELPTLIASTFEAVKKCMGGEVAPAAPKQEPAVAIKKSIAPDFIVCLEDGKKFKSLKRHIATYYGLTPEEYRAKWGLPADYPMVAPNFVAKCSDRAKRMGFGKIKAA